MKTVVAVSLFLLTLFLLAGCIMQNDRLDYRNDLSDYEVKKIVKKVLGSQYSITYAGLITSDGLENILQNASRYIPERYECSDGGYAIFTLSDGTFSLTLTTEALLQVEYHDCNYLPLYYTSGRINGSMEVIYHQEIEDYHNKVLDFSVHYLRTYLYTRLGEIFIDGELGIHFDEDYDRRLLSLVFSSNQLVIEDKSYYEKDIFNNIVLDYKIDTYRYDYEYSYSGTLYNSYLGHLSFTTLVPMKGFRHSNPYSGHFKISNSHMSLTLLPKDDYYVDIMVENYYHSNYNHTIHTTWINIGL